MEETELQQLARQLRKPEGDMGKMVGENMNIGNRLINEYALGVLNAHEGDNILEIGMGNGFFVQQILSVSPTIKYTGCDYSELMVAEAQKHNAQYVENGQARFIHSTADALPFSDHVFNKVLTINTIYFWEHPLREIAEIRRVLKAGGIFVIAVRPKHIMQQMPVTSYGFTHYAQEDLENLLHKAGFAVEEVINEEEPDMVLSGITMKKGTLVIKAKVS